jgi:predicted RNA-binding protein YlxR (DUF448 family)
MKLTVDHVTNEVHLKILQGDFPKIFGRSAYLCRSQKCLVAAFKGMRLRHALEGRKSKGSVTKRSIRWPLEPQLIKVIEEHCTEP